MIYAGQLNINVIRANFVDDKDAFGKMDPYIAIKIGQNEFRTKIANGAGKTPSWNETFTCFINGEQNLELSAFDDDHGKDELIGKDTISLAQVFQQRNVTMDFPVYDKKHEHEGTVTLNLAFNPTR